MNTKADERDLESRINARCMELVMRIDELETDLRTEAAEMRDRLEATLSELRHIIREGFVDGWASLADQVGSQIDHWLAESASELEVSRTESTP